MALAACVLGFQGNDADAGYTFPFVGGVEQSTFPPRPTLAPSVAFWGGFFDDKNNPLATPSPTPAPGHTAIPAMYTQELNAENIETRAGRPLGSLAWYTDPYYWTSTVVGADYCWASCPQPDDPRAVQSVAKHRLQLVSYSVSLPPAPSPSPSGAVAYFSMASYLPAAIAYASPLNFPTSYPTERYDTFYTGLAQKIKASHGYFLLRPFHEFNLCTNEYKNSSGNQCANGDSIAAFPKYWPPSCPMWPPGIGYPGCSLTTLAQEQLLFQIWWEYTYWYIETYQNANANLYFLWNPSYGGVVNPFTLAQLQGFLPTTCYLSGTYSCSAPVGGVYDVDMIGLDQYNNAAANPYANVPSAFYNYFVGDGIPLGYIESGTSSANTPQTAPPCATPVPTLGPNTQAQWMQDVVTNQNNGTLQWTVFSDFDSWSAYPNCKNVWTFDQYGLNGFLSIGGNAAFSQLIGASPAPTYTPFPTPTP